MRLVLCRPIPERSNSMISSLHFYKREEAFLKRASCCGVSANLLNWVMTFVANLFMKYIGYSFGGEHCSQQPHRFTATGRSIKLLLGRPSRASSPTHSFRWTSPAEPTTRG